MQNSATSQALSKFAGAQVSLTSTFDDDVWNLDIAQATQTRRILWSQPLGKHGFLTDPKHQKFLWSCKAIIFLMSKGDYGLYREAKPNTLGLYAETLLQLVRWMASRNILGFDKLTVENIRSYRMYVDTRGAITNNPSKLGPAKMGLLSDGRRQALLHPLRVLIALHSEIPFQPALNGEDVSDLLRIHINYKPESVTKPIPDEVAIPLFSEALSWVKFNGEALKYAYTFLADAHRSCKSIHKPERAKVARRLLRRQARGQNLISFGKRKLDVVDMTNNDVNSFVSYLESACFIIIAGLVGQRISEIGSLQAGCLESKPTSRGRNILLLHGVIYKTAKSVNGKPWKWVAGWDGPDNPVRLAVETLEALRAADQIEERWLFVTSQGRRSGSAQPLSSAHHNKHLNRFLGLCSSSDLTLAAHQFRKTFARFVTRRDFTGLAALKEHFGHVSIQMTEHYGFWDPDLIQEVLDEELVQDYEAFDSVISASSLAGKMGEAILLRNSRFRGIAGEDARRVEIASLKNEMSDDPMIVLRNDYGYCIFVQEQASCGGEQWKVGVATCISCSNFVVTEDHLPWWQREIKSLSDAIKLATFPFLDDDSQKALRQSLKCAKSVAEKLKTKSL